MDALIGKVHCIDALELLARLEPQSVDAIITDLPYGTTACSWDNIIPFEPMWAGVKRVLKPRGVFVTTASQPFTSALVMSNPKWFKYEWVYHKTRATTFANARIMPLKAHESIIVFCNGSAVYYPQMTSGTGYKMSKLAGGKMGGNDFKRNRFKLTGGELRYPQSVLQFSNSSSECNLHPTQKPLELYKYLINTYTQPNDLIVDFCCGSGTTAVAAATLNRRFIAGDTSAEYCAIARKRLETITPDMFELCEVAHG